MLHEEEKGSTIITITSKFTILELGPFLTEGPLPLVGLESTTCMSIHYISPQNNCQQLPAITLYNSARMY